MSRVFVAVAITMAGLSSVQTVSAMGLMQAANGIIGAEELVDVCSPDLKRNGRVPEFAAAFVAAIHELIYIDGCVLFIRITDDVTF